MELASTSHPAWNKLSDGAKKLMARNCNQIIGVDLDSPVDFVLNSWKQRLEMIMKDLNDGKTLDMFEEEPLTKEELMKKREQELLKVPAYNRNNTTFQDLMKG